MALSLDEMEALTLPVRGGDWVMNKSNHRVAQVRSCYRDWSDGEVLVDLILYRWDGDKTGRESPIEGGPRSFEPCCSYANWERIEKPEFPMVPKWVDQPDGSRVARYWSSPRPDGAYKRRKRRVQMVHSLKNTPDDGLDRALRLAAEELRETVRVKNLQGDAKAAVLARAGELEKQADETLRKA
jgi:hypothetical protein